MDELRAQLDEAPGLVGQNFVESVSCNGTYSFGVANLPAAHSFADAPAPASRHRVVAYDCGIKRGILEGLVRAGCDLTVVPWDTPAEDVLARTASFFPTAPVTPMRSRALTRK